MMFQKLHSQASTMSTSIERNKQKFKRRNPIINLDRAARLSKRSILKEYRKAIRVILKLLKKFIKPIKEALIQANKCLT